jgi:hypothetical protein
MKYQKLFVGLIFLLIFIGGVFSFFYFFFGEEMIKEITTTFSSIFSSKDHEGENKEIDPLIKEGNGDGGFLTREGIIEETNRQRALFGMLVLDEKERLNEIADVKLDDMFEKQYFAHVSPDGDGVSHIADGMEYKFLLIGDNLAMGNYRDDEEVVRAWMNSPGHRKNILEERYREIGVAAKEGLYREKTIWMAVQVFAMPTSACPEPSELLKKEIDKKRQEAETMLVDKESLEREIDLIRPRGSELHVQKVEEYNALINNYNNLIVFLDKLIDDYNQQLKAREDCILK